MKDTDNRELSLLCWEGYEAEVIRARFREASGYEIQAKTLLSDAAIADELFRGEHPRCNVLNINNAYIRDCLQPAGMIQTLDAGLEQRYLDAIHPLYQPFLPWSYSADGDLIGIGQRYGPFNLVINTRSISQRSAEQQGFALADEPRFKKRYAILDYPDFNLFHICIGAGIDPFQRLTGEQIRRFEETATRWLAQALLLDADHHRLNHALLAGEIDFYISGGIYTVSPARLQGHHQLLAVTPEHGPIDGKGGIAFSEITSLIKREHEHPGARAFLDFMLDPQTAIDIAFIDGTCNPVAQMGDARVFQAFNARQLQAIQWDTLPRQLQRCADYRLPPDRAVLLSRLEKIKTLYR